MRRNPLYTFEDRTSRGIYSVPLQSTVHILNDNGRSRFVEIISKTGLNVGSTIGDFLDNPNLYVDLSTLGEIPSELEKITENGQTGWRILGRDPNNYGDIGTEAIDLSRSTGESDVNGATGFNSFAVGENTIAEGNTTSVFGRGTQAKNNSQTVVGSFNTASNTDSIFEVGIGIDQYRKADGLIVENTGLVIAPSAELSLYDDADAKTLVTKEYVDDIDGGSIV